MARPDDDHRERRRGLLVLAGCVPLLAAGITLLAVGVLGTGFVITLAACTLLVVVVRRRGRW
jgi:Flp pilus assembly protein TadB